MTGGVEEKAHNTPGYRIPTASSPGLKGTGDHLECLTDHVNARNGILLSLRHGILTFLR